MKLTSEKIFKYPPTGMEAFLTILFIVTLGWLYSLLQLLNLKDGGGFGQFGPGMEILDLANFYFVDNPYSYLANLSFCSTPDGTWTIETWLGSFVMWFSMVLAMMVPSLLPSIRSKRFNSTFVFWFFLGYIIVWSLCCMVGVSLQWMLYSAGLLNNQMVISQPWFSSIIFFIIGVYQFSRFKMGACVSRKRLLDLAAGPSTSNADKLHYGKQYGLACVRGCCPLMLGMFALGLMNIVAMLALTLVMFMENNTPAIGQHAKLFGSASIALGFISLFYNFL